MLIGALWGLLAALLNSIGFLFGANYLRHYRSPFRLLVVAHFVMILLGIPCLLIFFPFAALAEPGCYLAALGLWIVAFAVGQSSFFMSLRFFEASRVSSLLGLKIIVLTVIFSLTTRSFPGWSKLLAVLMATGAAMIVNRHDGGSGRSDWRGMVFVMLTLVFYSLSDILETRMIRHIIDCGFPLLRSALAAVAACYTALGILMLPGLFFFRVTRRQLAQGAPYAALWFFSQVALLCCFAAILPVFGNVILASRGLISVLLGALLSWLGFRDCDANLSASQWALRGVGALLMIAAIALYSLS